MPFWLFETFSEIRSFSLQYVPMSFVFLAWRAFGCCLGFKTLGVYVLVLVCLVQETIKYDY